MKKKITQAEAADFALAIVQKLRSAYPDNSQFSLANAATLLTCLSTPGIQQSDLAERVGGVTPGAISKNLDTLGGRRKGSSAPRLVYKTRNADNYKENDIVITEEGEQFCKELAAVLTRAINKLGD